MARKFKPVDPKQNFVEMEKRLLEFWYQNGIVQKYLEKNKRSDRKFSFLDGPITANNPMGVHHAWGRTYKDLYQRYHNMLGEAGRFQNGFDEQGLWVEVEVEKELGFKSKKDIEKYGIDKFVQKCKERVAKYSAIQTEQSKRLGYFMDWGNSYHTSSDTNNYAIWNFLKVCHQKGYLYKGRDSVPWCPRCGTAISQHEILTEEYKELTHESIYFKLPIKNSNKEFLLVWTTTPWTIPGNIAVAVNKDETYEKYEVDGEFVWVLKKAIKRLLKDGVLPPNKATITEECKGAMLIGREYEAPFDNLDHVKEKLGNYQHRVISTNSQILPISEEEGTGLVHIASGAGAEDFAIGKKENLPVVDLIDEGAIYVNGMGDFSGKNAKDKPELIISHLKQKDNGRFLLTTKPYTHRYPTCWRCKTELVWRVVDEWYIAMDKKSNNKTLRQDMVEVAKKITWIPKFGLERELDWLKNMHDWLISKKRYWGLTLPIWECTKCRNFEVIGSKKELKEKAVDGWDKFEGHSPHRPWVDAVKIKCSKCGSTISRIPDVGNPWLDAGIVPFSTMPEDWFPADFITESFPGQFKNWFYSLIAESTVLKNTNPFKTVLGFATLLDEKGEEMHKSKGNAIEFNEAADKIGVDVMRWMYATQNPQANLLFGHHKADEVRRRFYLILWNCYKFFVDYANLANWLPEIDQSKIETRQTVLDAWIRTKLNKVVLDTNQYLSKFDAANASKTIEDFVINDLSTWYIRRSRDRIGSAADKSDQGIFLSTMHDVLHILSRILAPFTPFIAEEIYQNLTGEESVHLSDFPQGNKKFHHAELIEQMRIAREIAEKSHAIRKLEGIKVRQPLSKIKYGGEQLSAEIESIIAEEINVKEIVFKKGISISLDTKLTTELKAEGEAREIIRQIQQARKEAGCDLSEFVTVKLPTWPKEFEKEIKKQTLSLKLIKSDKLEIIR